MIVKSGGSGLSFLWLPHFERIATFHPIVFLSSETVGGLMIEFTCSCQLHKIDIFLWRLLNYGCCHIVYNPDGSFAISSSSDGGSNIA